MYDSMSEDGPIVAARAVLDGYRTALATAPLSQPPGREWMFRLSDALASVLDALDDQDQPDDDEPYCYTCGSPVGIFQDHGPDWHPYRGHGTAASPVELYDAGHAPEVAWRVAGAR